MGMPLATADLQMKLMETTAYFFWTNKCQLLIWMETGKQTVKLSLRPLLSVRKQHGWKWTPPSSLRTAFSWCFRLAYLSHKYVFVVSISIQRYKTQFGKCIVTIIITKVQYVLYIHVFSFLSIPTSVGYRIWQLNEAYLLFNGAQNVTVIMLQRSEHTARTPEGFTGLQKTVRNEIWSPE